MKENNAKLVKNLFKQWEVTTVLITTIKGAYDLGLITDYGAITTLFNVYLDAMKELIGTRKPWTKAEIEYNVTNIIMDKVDDLIEAEVKPLTSKIITEVWLISLVEGGIINER